MTSAVCVPRIVISICIVVSLSTFGVTLPSPFSQREQRLRGRERTRELAIFSTYTFCMVSQSCYWDSKKKKKKNFLKSSSRLQPFVPAFSLQKMYNNIEHLNHTTFSVLTVSILGYYKNKITRLYSLFHYSPSPIPAQPHHNTR